MSKAKDDVKIGIMAVAPTIVEKINHDERFRTELLQGCLGGFAPRVPIGYEDDGDQLLAAYVHFASGLARFQDLTDGLVAAVYRHSEVFARIGSIETVVTATLELMSQASPVTSKHHGKQWVYHNDIPMPTDDPRRGDAS